MGRLLSQIATDDGEEGLDLQQVQLSDIIAAALRDVNVRPQDVEVGVLVEAPPVIVDPVLLERSLVNVLSNAVRHNPRGQRVRIEVSVTGSMAQLRVVDRGPGIPPRERSTVLAPFQRLGDQRSGDGVGLGLSITQGFVEAMKGRLSLGDTPGGGLTVTIELPL